VDGQFQGFLPKIRVAELRARINHMRKIT
jgi:hypothetical protein